MREIHLYMLMQKGFPNLFVIKVYDLNFYTVPEKPLIHWHLNELGNTPKFVQTPEKILIKNKIKFNKNQ